MNTPLDEKLQLTTQKDGVVESGPTPPPNPLKGKINGVERASRLDNATLDGARVMATHSKLSLSDVLLQKMVDEANAISLRTFKYGSANDILTYWLADELSVQRYEQGKMQAQQVGTFTQEKLL